MIPIYRKLRKKMADDNKPMKYMRYAIGEILLVVIGILIALQINTWNEERKQRRTIKSVYSIIKSDLTYDIEKFDKIINQLSTQDSIFREVVDKKMTVEDYENCSECIYILGGYQDVALEKHGLKLLIDYGTLSDSQNDSLFSEINSFYSYYDTEISISQNEMWADYQDNMDYWKSNKPWFADWNTGIKNDEMILYMVNSWDYRNRVSATYYIIHENYLEQLKSYKKDALILIEEINKRIE